MTLADAGTTEYTIVRPEECPPVVLTAAQDLQYHLREITGAEFPMQTDADPLPPKAILLGNNKHLSALGVQPDWASLGDEGYIIKTAGEHLIIAGGPVRGTAYGIYGLLNDHLGCRWFTPQLSRIPKQQLLEFDAIDETFVPALMYRETFWVEAKDQLWNLRNRMNAAWIIRLDETHGGCFYYHGVHTFSSFCPPENYFVTHPEYFSLINGQRSADHTQLCLTNPDVLQLAIDWAKERFRTDPYAMIVDISQNDWANPCQCSACQAIAQAEESESGPVLWFVNQVADAIKEEFPGRFIGTLAYQYTRKAPKSLVPRDNVVIRLCSIECSFSEPLDSGTSPANDEFVRDIKDWNRKTSNLFIWDYTTNFSHYLQPFPNLLSLQPNIRFFIANGVKGVFEQGNYNGTGGGEMADLRNYLLARFLWNPDRDLDAEMTEFLNAFYGPAAESMRRYLDFAHDRATAGSHHIGLGYPPRGAYFLGDFVPRAKAFFDEAEKAAANEPEFLARVRKDRIPILYVEAWNGPDYYRVVDGVYRAVRSEQTRQCTDAFFAMAKEFNIDLVSEGRSMENARQWLATEPPSWPAVTLANADIKVDIVPALGGRIVGIETDGDGTNWIPLAHMASTPACGYQEKAGPAAQLLGNAAAFECALNGNEASLTAALDNGLNVQRSVSIPPSGAEVVLTTHIVNRNEQAQQSIFWACPQFAFDQSRAGLELLWKAADGWRGMPIDTPSGQQALEGPDFPVGEWGYLQKAEKRSVVHRFPADQCEAVETRWNEGEQTIEITSKPFDLASGANTTFTQRLTFLTTAQSLDLR